MTDLSTPDFADGLAPSPTEQAASWYLDQHEPMPAMQHAALQADFLAWLQASPLHVREYLAIAQLHGDLKAVMSLQTLGAGELQALAASEPSIMPLHPANRPLPARVAAQRIPPRRRRTLRWLAVASCVGVGVFGAVAIRIATTPPSAVYAADARAVRQLSLPDGSLVQLDRNSALAVRFDAHHRQLELLRGSALIDVGKDPARPLQVRMGASVLQDIGTVFAVQRDAKHDAGGMVTVLHGRVDVRAPRHPWLARWLARLGGHDSDTSVVAALGAGQQAVVDGNGALTVLRPHADVTQATTWLPDTIHFRQTTVADVARRLNAYSTTSLVIDDPQLADTRISGRFHARDLDAFVAYLQTLPGVRVARDGRHVRVLAAAAAQASGLHGVQRR